MAAKPPTYKDMISNTDIQKTHSAEITSAIRARYVLEKNSTLISLLGAAKAIQSDVEIDEEMKKRFSTSDVIAWEPLLQEATIERNGIFNPTGSQEISNRTHEGVDLSGLPAGTPILAVASGKVVANASEGEKKGWGNYVVIKHFSKSFPVTNEPAEDIRTLYAHLQERSPKKVGEPVNKGDIIGKLGSTGRSDGPHLHLEVFKNKKNVNPLQYLNSKKYKLANSLKITQ